MFDTDGYVEKRFLRQQVVEGRAGSRSRNFRFPIKLVFLPVLFLLLLVATPASWKAPTQVASAYEPPKTEPHPMDPALVELRRSKELDIPPPTRTTTGRILPAIENLATVDLAMDLAGTPTISKLPPATSLLGNKVAAKDKANNVVLYSIDPDLQKFLDQLISKADANSNAAVVMEAKTGRILAMSEKSKEMKGLLTHAGFPAASLFKIVTTAAAFDSGTLKKDDIIKYRGGDYTLTKWNYNYDPKRDKKSLSVAEALGKSVNPVFSRVALQYLSVDELRRYTHAFGFNYPLPFNLDLPVSMAYIPYGEYELGRTAAGFGDVYISPIHAASIIAGVASDGTLHEPSVVDRITTLSGTTRYQFHSKALSNMMKPETAHELLRALQQTTLTGTSRKEFISNKKSRLPGIPVAAKTGTLKGGTLDGINNWFIAAAPINNPELALAVLTVNENKPRMTASHMGRVILQQFFEK